LSLPITLTVSDDTTPVSVSAALEVIPSNAGDGSVVTSVCYRDHNGGQVIEGPGGLPTPFSAGGTSVSIPVSGVVFPGPGTWDVAPCGCFNTHFNAATFLVDAQGYGRTN
jgi:hypothetical protein